MLTWLHFDSQNPPKSRLGGVLGRLGTSWSVLGASLEPLRSVQDAPERESVIFHRFRRFFSGGSKDRAKPGASDPTP